MRELNPEGCQTWIHTDGFYGHQCQRQPVVTRDGKPYCKIHDPEYIKAKEAAWGSNFDKEYAEDQKRWALKAARHQATEGLTLQELQQVTPDKIRALILEG